MKIVYNWLKELWTRKRRAADLRARLSLAGTPVDAIEESRGRAGARRGNHGESS